MFQHDNIKQNNDCSSDGQSHPFRKSPFLSGLNRIVAGCDSFLNPRRILLLACAFGVFWILLYQLFNIEIYRDMANCYAWYSREFGRGHWDGLAIAALPPLNIFLGGLLVKCGAESYHAHMLISGLSFLLTIFPLYALLKNFLSGKAAAYGCFLFMMTPKLILFSGMGLLEATRDFFLVSAVYLLFLCWKNKAKVFHWILFGLSAGCLALSRGEGILMAGLLILSLLIRPLKDYQNLRTILRNSFLPLIVVCMAALAVTAPRLIETWKLTGYPVTDTRCIGFIRHLPFADHLFHNKRIPESPQIDPEWEAPDSPGQAAPPRFSVLRHCTSLLSQMSRGGYELYLIFAAIGIWALIRRRAWRREYTYLIAFSLLVSFGMSPYSMAYRYFVFLVPLLMVFTLQGILYLLEWAEKIHLRSVAWIVLTCVALIQTQNAWGRLLDQKDGKREMLMAQFIRENRASFLPPGEQSRKLIVYGDCLPEIIYRADEGRLIEYNTAHISPSLVSGYDLLIIEKEDRRHCDMLLKRKDLKAVSHPYEQDFLLLIPAGGEK